MARKKVIMKVRELTEVEVDTLSLVKRGANRVPFRITKSDGDSDMQFNLDNLFLKKRDVIAPALVAVAIADIKHSQPVIDALKKQGIEVDHVNQEDGSNAVTLMLGKDDALPEDAVAYKLSDHAAMIFTGIKKGLQTWPETGDFVENISTAGFIPSFRIASEVLNDTVRNILYEEGDADITKSAVTKALKDFAGYVEAVLNTVPVNAFKAEKAIGEIQKGLLLGTGLGEHPTSAAAAAATAAANDPLVVGRLSAVDIASSAAIAVAKKKDGDKPKSDEAYEKLGTKAGAKAGKAFDKAATLAAADLASDEKDDADGKDADEKDVDEKDVDGGDADDKDADDKDDKDADDGKDAADGKDGKDGKDGNAGGDAGDAGDDSTEAVTKALAALTATLESMSKSIDKKIDSVKDGIDKRLDGVEANVKKNEESISGTVHSDAADDEDGTTRVVVKGDPDAGMFETALDFGDVEQN